MFVFELKPKNWKQNERKRSAIISVFSFNSEAKQKIGSEIKRKEAKESKETLVCLFRFEAKKMKRNRCAPT
jgi:hypothetical protein